MGSISEKLIQAGLEKAMEIGRVEESFTVMGCRVTLESLGPTDYEAINQETSELEDLPYLNAYRVGHLSRSIVEINGVNLRGVDYIEVLDGGQPVKVERHAYLRDRVLSTWKKEAIDVGFRKFTDLVSKAEKAAEEGVEFVNQDEQPDEKLSRLLGEVKELLGEVPEELSTKILFDNGLVSSSSKQDLLVTEQKLSQLDNNREAPQRVVERVPVQPYVGVEPKQPIREMVDSPEEMMRSRTPVTAQQLKVPTVVPTSNQTRQPPPVMMSEASKRYAEIEAEGELDLDLDIPTPPHRVVDVPQNVVSLQKGVGEILEKRAPIKPQEFVLDQQPRGGINPRWKPPTG